MVKKRLEPGPYLEVTLDPYPCKTNAVPWHSLYCTINSEKVSSLITLLCIIGIILQGEGGDEQWRREGSQTQWDQEQKQVALFYQIRLPTYYIWLSSDKFLIDEFV